MFTMSLNYRKGLEGQLITIHVRNSKKKHILELQGFQATAAVGALDKIKKL